MIGRWITEGETVANEAMPAMPIVASDVYEWGPGGQLVVHTAYGPAGDCGGGVSRSFATARGATPTGRKSSTSRERSTRTC
jgi:hypothetical protein